MIELLTNETTPDKARIIEMLIGMMGYVEMQDEGIEFKNRAWQIYEEIWKGFDTYLALLIHHDSLLRSESVTLLCFFGKYSEIVLPHIQKTMLEEQNADAKQWMTKMFRIRFPNEEIPQ